MGLLALNRTHKDLIIIIRKIYLGPAITFIMKKIRIQIIMTLIVIRIPYHHFKQLNILPAKIVDILQEII